MHLSYHYGLTTSISSFRHKTEKIVQMRQINVIAVLTLYQRRRLLQAILQIEPWLCLLRTETTSFGQTNRGPRYLSPVLVQPKQTHTKVRITPGRCESALKLMWNNSTHQPKTGNAKRQAHRKSINTHSSVCVNTITAVWPEGPRWVGQVIALTPGCRTSYSSQISLGAQPELKLCCLIRAEGTTLSAGRANRNYVDRVSSA